MRRSFPLLILFSLSACSQGLAGSRPHTTQLRATRAPEKTATSEISSEQLGSWIDSYISAFGSGWGQANAAQGYVAVARDGKVLFQKAYGKANRETGASAGADTRFRIGSITKQFTATAILILAQKGLLALADPLSKHLVDYPKDVGGKVTLHHLLTHTSGIPSYTDDEALMQQDDQYKSQAEVLAVFKDKPLEFQPGARFKYSNSGYFLLGMIIEKVSGARYGDFLQENVLRPAGMTRTSTSDDPDAPDTAVGYALGATGELERVAPIDMSLPFSAGALRSTVHDLLAWDRALSGEHILNTLSKQRMYTPDKAGYAYGWFVSKEAGVQVVAHSGGIDGFTSHIARAPEAKLVAVALSNSADFDAAKMAQPALLMALSGERLAPPVERAVTAFPPSLLQSLAGSYELSEQDQEILKDRAPWIVPSVLTISVTTDNGSLFYKPVGQRQQQLFHGEDGVLFSKQGNVELLVQPSETPSGSTPGFVLKQYTLSLHYRRNAP